MRLIDSRSASAHEESGRLTTLPLAKPFGGLMIRNVYDRWSALAGHHPSPRSSKPGDISVRIPRTRCTTSAGGREAEEPTSIAT